MMGLNLRKLAAVVSAAAMLAVAGPVAVSTANAAETPAASETAAQHVFATFHYGKGDYGIPNSFNTVPVAVDKGASLKDAAAKAEAQYGQPKNEGNVFAGWSNDGVAALDGSTPIDGDVDLYPVFVKAATVTFNGLDAAASYTRDVTLKSGSKFSQFVDELKKTTSLPTPKPGYELVFSTDQDGKQPVPADQVVTDGLNVFAAFVAKPVEKVTVTFYEDESLSSVFKKVEDVEKGKTTFAELAKKVGTPTREGKVFVGWTAAGVDGVISPDSTETFRWDRAFFAVWKDAVNYAVTFSAWTPDRQVRIAFNDGRTHQFQEYQDRLDRAVPAIDGYDFIGWTYDIHGGEKDLVDSTAPVTADRTAYPVYVPAEQPAPATVRVTFLKANGSPIVYREVAKGTLFGVASQGIQAPTVPGKVFTGWAQQGGALTEEGYALETDLTVTATYRDVYQPQPQFPWWGNWWTAFQHWWGSWNHWFNGWWR